MLLPLIRRIIGTGGLRAFMLYRCAALRLTVRLTDTQNPLNLCRMANEIFITINGSRKRDSQTSFSVPFPRSAGRALKFLKLAKVKARHPFQNSR